MKSWRMMYVCCLALALPLGRQVVSAQENVVYRHLTTLNPDPNFPWDFQGLRLLSANPQSYNLDFNNDGVAEYIVRASGPFSAPHSFGLYPQGLNQVWVKPTSDTSFAAALEEGVEIGSALSSSTYQWQQNPGEAAVFSAAMDVFTLGEYAGVDSAFCALRFEVDGETHYGWLRVGAPMAALNGGWLYDYAYDTRPDMAIVAQVPEPATWVLVVGSGLLIGAVKCRRCFRVQRFYRKSGGSQASLDFQG